MISCKNKFQYELLKASMASLSRNSKLEEKQSRDLYSSYKSDIPESREFCTICSKNLNIAHGGRNDYECHVEFPIVFI